MKKLLSLLTLTALTLLISFTPSALAASNTGWEKYLDGFEYFEYEEVTSNDPLIIEIEDANDYYIEYAINHRLGVIIPEYERIELENGDKLKIVRSGVEVPDSFWLIGYQLYKVSGETETKLQETPYDVEQDAYSFLIRRFLKTGTGVANLPETSGNNNTSDIGTVNFIIDGTNLVAEIFLYGQVYFLEYSFQHGTDMTIFEATEAYYINPDGDSPSIFINNSDFLNLLDIIVAPDDEKPAFVPHTVWDLKTNELKTVSQYTTYVYIKQMTTGPMIAYTYIDDFIIDKLLSIQVSWTDRQMNGWPMSWFKKYSDWNQHVETYTDDDYLSYRNLYTNWQHLIPVWNIFKIAHQASTFYEMPRIDAVNFNNIQPEYNITKTELEMYFHKLDNNFNQLKDNPRYKVWAIALRGGKTSSVGMAQAQIYHNEDDLSDPKNFHILHMTYQTNGILYETIGDHMNLKVIVNEELLPKESFNLTALIAMLVVGILLAAAFQAKAFTSPKKTISFIFAVILILGFAIVAYKIALDGSLFDLIGP